MEQPVLQPAACVIGEAASGAITLPALNAVMIRAEPGCSKPAATATLW